MPLTSDDIQNAIDALPPSGGVVHLAAGIYETTRAIEILKDNVCLRGMGQGITVLDSTGAGTVETMNYRSSSASYGVVTIDSQVSGEALGGISVADLTLRASADESVPEWQKSIFVGATDGCVIERVECDGARTAAIYHEDNWGKASRNWTVKECIIRNHGIAINSNDTELDGLLCHRNVVEDGEHGILFVGKRATIDHNVIRRQRAYGIALMHERFDVIYNQDVVVDHNLIVDTGTGYDGPRYGISAILSAAYGDGGVIISHNVISRMHHVHRMPCYGIRAHGNITMDHNVFREAVGDSLEAAAIVVMDDPEGVESWAVVDGNVVEPAEPELRYGWGFRIASEPPTHGMFRGNVVMPGAIRDGGWAFYDQRGAALLDHNLFSARFIFGGQVYQAQQSPISTPEMLLNGI